ncbi:gluconate 2-dehydrogenase subunit 3 family protein [Nocardiopsis coralliicola]
MRGSGGDDGGGGARRGPTRRGLFAGAGGVAAGGLVAGGLVARDLDGAGGSDPEPDGGGPPPLRFFTDEEAADVEAMAERVFPADRSGPGARDAGVLHYIDGRLAGGWGRGAGLYLQGPFEEPDHGGHGEQLPIPPREMYRHALGRIDRHCRTSFGDRALAELGPERQDGVLSALEAGEIGFGLGEGFTAASFFAMFLRNVTEGLFADPVHGGNRGMAGWKWVGFPGDPWAYGEPYAAFAGAVDPAYRAEPKGVQ